MMDPLCIGVRATHKAIVAHLVADSLLYVIILKAF